jgi:DNA-binding NarL/FixJ family response regulator
VKDKKMKKIILYTLQDSIKKHWNDALASQYKRVNINSQDELMQYIKKSSEPLTVMIDEDSLKNLNETLIELKSYKQATILFFKSLPEVHHASLIIGNNVKGYENAFINKYNLLEMLKNIEIGKSWLFTDLTNYIISKFVQDTKSNEPDFMPLLTQTQKDIAIMVANGLSNKEIAQAKDIALSTVKGHINQIFQKADVSDRVSLALKFR